MPRKAFVQDLQGAATLNFEGISSIQPGEDDGTVSFIYTPSSESYGKVTIQAMAPGEFPLDHEYNC